jgi:UPF0716 protein FxsA
VTLLLLALVFIVGPIAELYVIIQVAHVIGGWQTIALLLAESFVGAWLMKAQGRGVLTRIQRSLREGRMPTKELVDGGLILFAGALMLTPGFLTDVLGFILLIPPTRAVVRAALMRRFRDRLGTGYSILGGDGGPRATTFSFGRRASTSGGRDSVYDTTGREQDHRHELP